ncbi:MAG: hypothetical protein KAT74_11575, partial [Candidatus Cloacimonetes bacterium]|nr:hypothetical protein [Candidatus Cloacimonadota bacterium]
MKQIGFLIIILFFSLNLSASITVEYKSKLAPEIINTEMINEIEYFNVFELNKTFKAKIMEDLLDQRLNVNIYGEQLIFLLESSYVFFHSETYSFSYDIVQKDGKYYIPVVFLKEIFPDIFPDKITFEKGNIIAETPVDSSI